MCTCCFLNIILYCIVLYCIIKTQCSTSFTPICHRQLQYLQWCVFSFSFYVFLFILFIYLFFWSSFLLLTAALCKVPTLQAASHSNRFFLYLNAAQCRFQLIGPESHITHVTAGSTWQSGPARQYGCSTTVSWVFCFLTALWQTAISNVI